MEKKYYQLPKEFAEKWVKALRSGEYKQGARVLYHFNDTYCCLGVAGHICGNSLNDLGGCQWLGKRHNVPKELIGTRVSNDLVSLLSDMNDYKTKSFNEIADWIEQNVEFI